MIYLGADHGGFDLKEKIKKWLKRWGYAWEDMGNKFYEKEDDYPRFAILVAQKVGGDANNNYLAPWANRPKGIITCRSAAGMVIAANKVKGARCITANDVRAAKHSREHNDANIIALSGDWTDEFTAKKILKVWLATEFSKDERHIRRLDQISQYEKN